jgi:hypothetical protein
VLTADENLHEKRAKLRMTRFRLVTGAEPKGGPSQRLEALCFLKSLLDDDCMRAMSSEADSRFVLIQRQYSGPA